MTTLEITQMIIGILVSIGTFLGLSAAGVRWLVKHYLAELKPNGGGSLKDKINKVELEQASLKERLDEADIVRRNMDKKLDRLYDLMITYVASKNDNNK